MTAYMVHPLWIQVPPRERRADLCSLSHASVLGVVVSGCSSILVERSQHTVDNGYIHICSVLHDALIVVANRSGSIAAKSFQSRKRSRHDKFISLSGWLAEQRLVFPSWREPNGRFH